MGKVNIVEKDGKKYIDSEEVLCEYELDVGIIKGTLFLIFGIIVFFYIKSKNFDVNIVWWGFFCAIIAITIVATIKDIKSILVKKVYLTQKHIITFNGYKMSLDEIYFKYKTYFDYAGIFCWNEILFYKNNKFVFYTNVNKNNEKYKIFINTLIFISENQEIAKELQNYYATRKLIQTIGENNGK